MIINQPFDEVFSKYETYHNKLELQEPTEASMDNSSFSTTLKIADEDYFDGNSNPYLKLKYKKSPTSPTLVNSEWEIKLKKIDDNRTELMVLLKKIIPSKEAKGNIIINESISSGQLEQEIAAFLENEQEVAEISEEEESNNEEYTEYVYAENSSTLDFTNFKQMFDSKKLIPLPTTLEFFTQNIGENPDVKTNEACLNDEYYSWNFENNVNLIYYILKDKNQVYSLSYFGEEEINGLPFDLVFNQSTFNECKQKFSANGAEWYQETEEIPNTNTSRAFLILEFKYEKYYVQLGFYNNEYVTSIQVSTSK